MSDLQVVIIDDLTAEIERLKESRDRLYLLGAEMVKIIRPNLPNCADVFEKNMAAARDGQVETLTARVEEAEQAMHEMEHERNRAEQEDETLTRALEAGDELAVTCMPVCINGVEQLVYSSSARERYIELSAATREGGGRDAGSRADGGGDE